MRGPPPACLRYGALPEGVEVGLKSRAVGTGGGLTVPASYMGPRAEEEASVEDEESGLIPY